jgi:hypothetical protein
MSGKRPSLGKSLLDGADGPSASWQESKADLTAQIRQLLEKYREWNRQKFSERGREIAQEVLRGADRISARLADLEELALAADRKQVEMRTSDVMELKQFVVEQKERMADVTAALRRAAKASGLRARRDVFGQDEHKVRTGPVDRAAERRMLENEQDRAMDGIDEKLGVLHDHAQNVFSQLEAQNKLIDGLNDDVSEAQRAFDKVNEKLGAFLQTNDRCQTTTACVLFGVLLFVMLVLYPMFW